MSLVVGYAWVFENIVIYGNGHSLLSMIGHKHRKNFGEFLGVVKGVIPEDPYFVLYEYLKDTKGFRKRQQERRVLKRLGLSIRKMKTLKRHGQQTLFLRKTYRTI